MADNDNKTCQGLIEVYVVLRFVMVCFMRVLCMLVVMSHFQGLRTEK